MYYIVEGLPWPMWPRDAVFSSNVIFDKENKGFLICSSSLEKEESWFGHKIPPNDPKCVRMHVKRECHFFQRLDENTTRYVCIFNTDLFLAMTPTSILNWLTKMICETLVVQIKEKAEAFDTLGLKDRQRQP
mmetsp:Transcript_24299/g.23907  ORF Transcript_24299/g.23907 Transcript_24299/m.23907 type:complete len:132 (+) Transcript_24299:522-917(+)